MATEQSVCLKFCVANKISLAESLKMLQKVYGESAISETQAKDWYNAFQEGREVTEDVLIAERPSASVTDEKITKIQAFILENPHLSFKGMAKELTMSDETIHCSVTEVLGLKRIASRLVPKELNLYQKEHRKEVAEDMLETTNSDPSFTKRIVTGDQTWLYGVQTACGSQVLDWLFSNDLDSDSLQEQTGKFKVMLAIYFDYRGIVHSELISERQAFNKECYLGIMKRLKESLRRKRPDLLDSNFWYLHHYAPSLISSTVREFLTQNQICEIDQPPYSPDLAPCDFFLFKQLKSLREKRFESIEDMKKNLQQELKTIPPIAFNKCFDDWITRWRNCVEVNGEYLEDSEVNVDD